MNGGGGGGGDRYLLNILIPLYSSADAGSPWSLIFSFWRKLKVFCITVALIYVTTNSL